MSWVWGWEWYFGGFVAYLLLYFLYIDKKNDD